MPREAIEKLGEDGFARHPIGSGPFALKSFVTDQGAAKRAKLQHTVDELRAAIDGWATTIEENLSHEVVPIRNLVEVQYGALLVALQAKGL
mgnify:FL=1